MLPILSVPNAQVPAPIQTSAVVNNVPAQALPPANITYNAVPSPLSNSEIYNNSRSTPPLRAPATPESAEVKTPGYQPVSARVGVTQGFGFSSTFLAQIFGQGASADGDLFTSFLKDFLPNSPTPNRETLEAFSQTKYMPSNAFKPAAQPRGVAQLNVAQAASVAANQNVGASAAASDQTSMVESIRQAVQPETSSANVSSTASIGMAGAGNSQPIRIDTTAQSQQRSNDQALRSLINNARGSDAYTASNTRNTSLISLSAPEYNLAL